LSSNKKIIAFLGKGGTGKTALSALCGRALIASRQKILFIDADPAMGLCCALALKPRSTVADAREQLIKGARSAKSKSDKEELAAMLDYILLECLLETREFSLLAMGRPQAKGCYCAVNSLLRESISALAENFGCTIIDAEAGIEQVSREVIAKVTHPLIVSDNSLRGVMTAEAIRTALVQTCGLKPVGVIFNRCAPSRELKRRLCSARLKCLGAVPADRNITKLDLHGRSLLALARTSPALRSLSRILGRLRLS